jgi:hypothetical protein
MAGAGGQPAVDCVFDDRVEVLVVEHPGEVDQRPCRAREGDGSEHAAVVHVDATAMHDHAFRFGRVRVGHPELGLLGSQAVEAPEHSGRREGQHRVGSRPQLRRERGLLGRAR